MNARTFQNKTKNVIDEFLRRGETGLSSVELSNQKSLHITRQGALKTLNRLTRAQLLEKKPVLSAEHRPVDKYRLNNDRKSFIELTTTYVYTLMKKYPTDWQGLSLWPLMNSKYVQDSLTLDFVKYILSKKKVILRKVVIRDHRNGKQRSSKMGTLVECMFDEQLLLRVEEFSPNMGKRGKAMDTFSGELTDYAERNVCLPILAMIKMSPSALIRFTDDWDPFEDPEGSVTGDFTASIDHLLFRLVWDTANDISIARNLPETSGYILASVGGVNTQITPLLKIVVDGKRTINYYVEFSTVHEYYGGEAFDDVSEITWNPENARVKIDVMDTDDELSSFQRSS